MARLAPEEYEPHLKDALVCFHCGEAMKNMPTLKKHLQEEFDALRKREVGKLKRKRETVSASESASGSHDGGKQIGKAARTSSAAQAKG
jgi:aprataxin